MFNDQIQRLMREDWEKVGVNALAQELVTILSAAKPVAHDNNLALTNQQGTSGPPAPVLSLTQAAGEPILQATNADGTQQLNVNTTETGNVQFTKQDGSNALDIPRQVWLGKVVSGKGDTYQVAIWTGNLTGPTQQVQVKVAQMAAAETLPRDAVMVVVQSGNQYMGYIGVFLK